MHVTNGSSDDWLGLNGECGTRHRTHAACESGGHPKRAVARKKSASLIKRLISEHATSRVAREW